MARTSIWSEKVLTLIRAGNTDAAIAQIKVAPSLKDLQALQAAIIVHRLKGRWNVLIRVNLYVGARRRRQAPCAR